MSVQIVLFDLDDTLYPCETGIWPVLANRICAYMQDRLNIPTENIQTIRDQYFHQYGTTLKGLEKNYGVDPVDYLSYVHDIDVRQYVQPDPALEQLLAQIPQPKVICTNADRGHSQRVTKALGVEQHFTQVVDVLRMEPYCKPATEAFLKVIEVLGDPDPSHYLLVDDSQRNVESASNVGMQTVLVRTGCTPANGIRQIDRVHDLLKVWDPQTGRFYD